jgi:threonine dehydrogenase-like Zn-dependent dehydrogenase
MRGAILYGPGDVRFEERAEPKIMEPTDGVIGTAAIGVCCSDLWPYRGLQAVAQPTPFGHEYCGIVEETGGAVRSVKPGQFVIGSFFNGGRRNAAAQTWKKRPGGRGDRARPLTAARRAQSNI